MTSVDPDLQGLPAHRSPRLLLLVLIGGAVGAPLRYLLSHALPAATDTWPSATFLTNTSGAFLLGVLLELLRRSGRDDGARRGLRLLLGTGALGAFTTYSTLAVETDLLVDHGHAGLAAAYCCISVAVGVVAAVAGIVVARVIPVWSVGR